jgi:DNA primase
MGGDGGWGGESERRRKMNVHLEPGCGRIGGGKEARMYLDKKSMDLEQLKRGLSIMKVLSWYGYEGFKKVGPEYVGACVVHGGDNTTALHINPEKNLWHCFTRCGGGTVIDMVMMLEGVGVGEALGKLRVIAEEAGFRPAEVKREENKQVKECPCPMTIDPWHHTLEERGLSYELAEQFGMGYCSRGYFHDRIVVPVHDGEGKLLGYIGRSASGMEPKYLLPRGFPIGKILFNLHRVKDAGRVVVVEGVFDAVRVHAAGYPVVALLGSQLTQGQAVLLRGFRSVVYLFDGDEAGRMAAEKILEREDLPEGIRVDLPEGKDPGDMVADEIRRRVGVHFGQKDEEGLAREEKGKGSGKRLSVEKKVEIFKEAVVAGNRREVADRYGIHPSSMYEVLRQGEGILQEGFSRNRVGRPSKEASMSPEEAQEKIKQQEEKIKELESERDIEHVRRVAEELKVKWAVADFKFLEEEERSKKGKKRRRKKKGSKKKQKEEVVQQIDRLKGECKTMERRADRQVVRHKRTKLPSVEERSGREEREGKRPDA